MSWRRQGQRSANKADTRLQPSSPSAGHSTGAGGGLLSALVATLVWLGVAAVMVAAGRFQLWHGLFLGGALLLSLPFVIGATGRKLRNRPGREPDAILNLYSSTTARAGAALSEDRDLRYLREEIARILAAQPGVSFAALLAAPGFQNESRGASGLGKDEEIVFWRSGESLPEWRKLPRESHVFFDQVKLQPEQTYYAGERYVLAESGLRADLLGSCDSWLMTPAGTPDQVPLLILVGLRRRLVGTDLLQEVIEGVKAQIAPVLAVHHNLVLMRRRLEAVGAEKEALERLSKLQGDFVAVASHELKTPLTSIGAYTEVLLQNTGKPDFAHRDEFLGIIKEEAERLLRMVNRILDFSRLEFGRRLLGKELVVLAPLVEETLRTLGPHVERKQQRLVVDCPTDLPLVEIDTDLIRQVLINLVSNAVKYTPRGGNITIRAKEDAATVKVDVQDTGPGIPAEELRSIFRQFYRVRGSEATEEGAGLGLAIVKNIIDMHNGHIDVKSREGKGATFSFHLPKEYYFSSSRVVVLGDLPAQVNFQEIMRLCVRMIAELMESRAVVFMLLDDEEKELVIQSALGLPPAHAESYRAPKRQGLLGEVILTGEPKLGCAEEDDGPLAVVVTPAVAGPTQASAPLVIGRRVVGVVAVANKVDLTPYDADDLNLLVTLCERVSAALTGALKYSGDANRLAKIVEALETLVKMKHSSIPTVNPLALRLLGRTAGLLGLSPSEVKRLQYLVALHDAGMVRVDEEIIHKRGELTEDERDEVDSHVEKGAHLMAPLLLRPEMEEIILSHHERVDGTGYPAGRQGGEIPLGSRILAVLDAFFAMIQSRPYRKKLPAAEVVKEIRTHAGTQFDPAVVDGFLQVLCEEGIVTADTENSANFMGLTPTTPDEEEQTWQPLGS